MTPSTSPLDVAFVFAVCAGALIWPPLALVVGAVFMALNYLLAELARRRPE